MNPAVDWADFHDATIVSVTADWQSATATVKTLFKEATPRLVEIVVSGCTRVVWSRAMPWFASDSINEVRRTAREGGVRVEIEVQSGDTIEVEGSAVVVNADGLT